jgi:hypothetical protein
MAPSPDPYASGAVLPVLEEEADLTNDLLLED